MLYFTSLKYLGMNFLDLIEKSFVKIYVNTCIYIYLRNAESQSIKIKNMFFASMMFPNVIDIILKMFDVHM